MDANQQTSSTELLCEGGSEEHIDDVTEKIEVARSPDDLNSEGLVIKDGNSSTKFAFGYSRSKVPNDFIAAIQGLTSTERYSLLKHHEVPPSDYIFPFRPLARALIVILNF